MRPARYMSGHCAHPATDTPQKSHERCPGGNRANPGKEFSPCPCPCHLGADEFECAGCGRPLRIALRWPQEDPETPDDPVYTHIDKEGRALGEECLT